MSPIAESVDLLAPTEGPLAGNGAEGTTQGFFQFDRVTNRGSVGPAYHVETPTSDEGKLQMRWFLDSALETGVPEIIDPFAELETPAL
jgi:hypothetical protein